MAETTYTTTTTTTIFDAADTPVPSPVFLTALEWILFSVTCLVCLGSFLIATSFALSYLRTGRPLGAPYVYRMPLSLSMPAHHDGNRDEESQLRCEFGSDVKGY